MVKCEKCLFTMAGKGPVLCPQCGYVMFDIKEIKEKKRKAPEVAAHDEEVNYGN